MYILNKNEMKNSNTILLQETLYDQNDKITPIGRNKLPKNKKKNFIFNFEYENNKKLNTKINAEMKSVFSVW